MPLGVVLALGRRGGERAPVSGRWQRVRKWGLPVGLALAAAGSALATHRTLHHTRQWIDLAAVDLGTDAHWQSSLDARADAEWRNLIPTNARVSAAHHLVPHLVQQPVLKGFPDVQGCDYVVVYDFPEGDAPYQRAEVMRAVSRLMASGEWHQLAQSPGLYVLKRNTAPR